MSSPRLDNEIKRYPNRFLKDFTPQNPSLDSKEQFSEKYINWMRNDPKGIQCADYLDEENLNELWNGYKELAEPVEFTFFDGIAKKKKGKILIKTKKKTRRFKEQNIKVTKGKYRGKNAIYFYNIKTKKRISWGLIKQ
jgi:hypothetical protein